MSNFDLNLDRWNKVFTIVIGILGLIVSSYVAVFVIYPAHNRDNAKACFDARTTIKSDILNNPTGDTTTYKNDLKKICNISYEKAEADVNSMVAETTALPKSQETGLMGSVSLGKADNYQTSNFRNFETGEKALKQKELLKKGAILIARWSVNLRKNKKDTTTGDNPSIAIIYDNKCVKMEEDLPPAKRGSYWVKVSLFDC